MLSRLPDINFTVIIGEERHAIESFKGEYRNLMMLLYDKFYLEDFGECKGIGRCGTCHIQLLNNSGELLQRVGNEGTTLTKMDGVTDHSRLACQINVDEKLEGAVIVVVVQ